jgi:hypothetical protein
MYGKRYPLDFVDKDLMLEDVKSSVRMIDIAVWLVTYGSSPDILNIHGE